jgi:PAS domain S-box-containing protein
MKLPFRKSYLRLLVIMILICLITTGICISIIYRVVYNEKKSYLRELCVNQQNIIKSIYKETNDTIKILNILKEQNSNHSILGETGEYAIAFRQNDSIYFLLDLRRSGYSNLHPIPWESTMGEPIKYALSKMTGFITGQDYSNTKVLAYCIYIPEVDWGLITKMDISEVNYPFYRAGEFAFLATLVLVLFGTLVFKKSFDPIIEEIVDSENRYRNLFDFSAIPIWEVDFSTVKTHFDKLKESGITNFRTYFENKKNEVKYLTSLIKITYVNQKSITFFEANNRDEIIKSLLAYFNDDSLEVFKNELAGFADGITHFETELPVRTLKGEIKTLLFHMSVMPGHENNLSEVLISFVDITKRKVAEEALREREQKLKYHFENSPLAVVEWDTDYHIINWSKEAEHIFGWKSDEVTGKKIDTLNLIYEEDIPIVNRTIERLSGGKESTIVSSNRNYTKSGDVIECIWYNSVLLDDKGNMASTMSLVADITERKKAEEALRESEENMRTFLDATQESLYMFDKRGKILIVNSTAAKRFKLSPADLIGHNISEFLPESLTASRMTRITEVADTGNPVKFEDTRNNISFEHNFFPVVKDDKVTGVVSFSRDITEIKKAQEAIRISEEKFRAIAVNTPDHILIQDSDLRYVAVINPQLGLKEYEMMGKTDFDFLSDSDARNLTEIKRKVIESGNSVTLMVPLTDRHGDLQHFEGSYIPKRNSDGKADGIIGYFRNVTRRIKMEEELINSETRLRELIATKDKFFNIVAHDLKNPFTSMLGSTELLFDNIGLMDTKQIKRLAQILNDSAKSGYAILLNLLDWSRSQTGLIKPNPEEFNLKGLIDKNISEIKLNATNKQLKIDSAENEDIFIFADKNMINTVLRNLLSNGVKFTRKGGKVTVVVTETENEVIISVKDTGVGVSEENVKKLFRIDTKFQMPGTDNEQGTGLGLKLCKEFVEKLGGKIWVESVENKGSDFKFSIPVK